MRFHASQTAYPLILDLQRCFVYCPQCSRLLHCLCMLFGSLEALELFLVLVFGICIINVSTLYITLVNTVYSIHSVCLHYPIVRNIYSITLLALFLSHYTHYLLYPNTLSHLLSSIIIIIIIIIYIAFFLNNSKHIIYC